MDLKRNRTRSWSTDRGYKDRHFMRRKGSFGNEKNRGEERQEGGQYERERVKKKVSFNVREIK